MFSSEEVTESSTCDIFVDAHSFNLESEISVTSSKSKLNPLAKPFEILNENTLSNPSASLHAKQSHGMPLQETGAASGSNFVPFRDGTSLDISILLDCTPQIINDVMTPNGGISLDMSTLLDCTPQIINDAMTPDISKRSDGHKTFD